MAMAQPVQYAQPVQGQPMMAQPIQGQPMQAAQPNIVISNNQQVGGGGVKAGQGDADAALMIFVVGWFCPICVWLFGGCMYIRSPDATARMWSMISLGCGVAELVATIILVVTIVNTTNSLVNSIYSY